MSSESKSNWILPAAIAFGVLVYPWLSTRANNSGYRKQRNIQNYSQSSQASQRDYFSPPSQSQQGKLNQLKVLKSIGIEVGGTGIYIGHGLKYVNPNGEVNRIDILDKKYFRTNPTDPEASIVEICEYIKQFEFSSIGIASFGPLCLNKQDPDYGNITTTPKQGWQNYPLVKRIAHHLNIDPLEIGFDTDVNACALAEATLGRHLNQTNTLIYITVGTGVGVGLIVNGQPVHGLMHPEGGHMMIPLLPEDQGFEGTCLFHKNCLEGLVTNTSLAKRKQLDDVMEVGQLSDEDPVWDIIAHYLSVFCANLAYVCSPETIVLGGGIMKRKLLYQKIADKLEKTFKGYLVLYKKDAHNFISPPKCGEDNGLIAAINL